MAQLSAVPGAKLYLVPVQDFNTTGGRQTNAAYQYTLQADSTADLYEWAPKLVAALEHDPVLRDVNSDQQQKGLETDVVIDRATASRLGVNAAEIDNTLYDAFGQRQVSTIYKARNQYHVIMEVAPRYWQSPANAAGISTSAPRADRPQASRSQTPLWARSLLPRHAGTTTAATHRRQFRTQRSDERAGEHRQGHCVIGRRGQHEQGNDDPVRRLRPLSRRQHGTGGQPPGVLCRQPRSLSIWHPAKSLSDATAAIEQAMRQIGMPATIRGSFPGGGARLSSNR